MEKAFKNLIIIPVLIYFFCMVIPAETIYVDSSVQGGYFDGSIAYPFSSVARAVEIAGYGDTIMIAQGIYRERIIISNNSGIRLYGGYKSGNFDKRDIKTFRTVFKGYAKDAVIEINYTGGYGDYQVYEIDGLTIEGGDRGIYAMNWGNGGNAELIVTECILQYNSGLTGSGDYGGGICSRGMIAVIKNNLIRNNSCGKGGGLFVQLSSSEYSFIIEGNTVQDNSIYSDHGAGSYVQGYSGLIGGNTFRSNIILEGWGWGGGLIIDGNQYSGYTDTTYIQLSGNVYDSNESPSGGSGLFIDEGANVRMKNELLINNMTYGGSRDGALYVDGTRANASAKTILENCTIANNTGGDYSYGHAVYVEGGSEVTARNSIFWNNRCSDNQNDFYVSSDSYLNVEYSIYESGKTGSGYFSEMECIQDDPLFANSQADNYYLESRAGRWNPAISEWVEDELHSPGIDAGNPLSDYMQEPCPNGNRVNLGCYGNTSHASKSINEDPPHKDKAVMSLKKPEVKGTYIWYWEEDKNLLMEEKASHWNKISEIDAVKLLAGDIIGDGNTEIIAYFTGMGLWYYSIEGNLWVNIMDSSAPCLDFTLVKNNASEPLKIAASFEELGLYIRETGGIWTRIFHIPAQILLSCNFDRDINGIDEIFTVFSGINGLYKYDFSTQMFNRIIFYSPCAMKTADITGDTHPEIICCFESAGTYILSLAEEKDIMGVQWARIAMAVPQTGHDISCADIAGGNGAEIFLPYTDRTYCYEHETGSWSCFLMAPLKRMQEGRFSGGYKDDLIACESAQGSVYMYNSSSSAWEIIAYQADVEVMEAF